MADAEGNQNDEFIDIQNPGEDPNQDVVEEPEDQTNLDIPADDFGDDGEAENQDPIPVLEDVTDQGLSLFKVPEKSNRSLFFQVLLAGLKYLKSKEEKEDVEISAIKKAEKRLLSKKKLQKTEDWSEEDLLNLAEELNIDIGERFVEKKGSKTSGKKRYQPKNEQAIDSVWYWRETVEGSEMFFLVLPENKDFVLKVDEGEVEFYKTMNDALGRASFQVFDVLNESGRRPDDILNEYLGDIDVVRVIDTAALDPILDMMIKTMMEEKVNRREAAVKLQRSLQKFQQENREDLPSSLVALFNYVVSVIGETSTGKDMIIARLTNFCGLSLSGTEAFTRAPEEISIQFDDNLKTVNGKHDVRVDVSENYTEEGKRVNLEGISLEAGNAHRRRIHELLKNQGEKGVFGEYPINIHIRTSNPDTPTRTFLNFPGFGSFSPDKESPERDLFRFIDRTVSDLDRYGNGCLMIVRSPKHAFLNDHWISLDSFEKAKSHNFDVMIVVTHGDTMDNPKVMGSYKEQYAFFFEQYEKHVKDADYHFVTNWQDDTVNALPGAPTRDFGKDLEKIFNDKLRRMWSTLADRDTNQKEKKKLEAVFGVDNLIESYSQLIVENIAKPFLLFSKGMEKSLNSLTLAIREDMREIRKLESGKIGRYFQEFAEDFATFGRSIFIGEIPDDSGFRKECEELSLDAKDEFDALLESEMFSPLPEIAVRNLGEEGNNVKANHFEWKKIIAEGDENEVKEFTVHMNRARFDRNFVKLIKLIKFPDIDDDFAKAAVRRSERSNLPDRTKPLVDHILKNAKEAVTPMIEFIAKYLAFQVHRAAKGVAKIILGRDKYKILSAPGPSSVIYETIDAVYGADLLIVLLDRLNKLKLTVKEVTFDKEAQEKIWEVIKSNSKDDRLSLLRKHFNNILKDFVSHSLKAIAAMVLHDFGILSEGMDFPTRWRILFKHIVIQVIAPEIILRQIGNYKEGISEKTFAAESTTEDELQENENTEGQAKKKDGIRAIPSNYLVKTGYYGRGRRRINPPEITELQSVTDMDLLGFLHCWEKEVHSVLYPAYWQMPTDNAITRSKIALDEAFDEHIERRIKLYHRIKSDIKQGSKIWRFLHYSTDFADAMFSDRNMTNELAATKNVRDSFKMAKKDFEEMKAPERKPTASKSGISSSSKEEKKSRLDHLRQEDAEFKSISSSQ